MLRLNFRLTLSRDGGVLFFFFVNIAEADTKAMVLQAKTDGKMAPFMD
jgi:hypothetical protein